jgi:hypothetical protein
VVETNENLHTSCGDVCDKIVETQSSGKESIDVVGFIKLSYCIVSCSVWWCFVLLYFKAKIREGWNKIREKKSI